MGWSTSIVSPPDGDMGDYMRSLDKLSHRDDKIYYPTHGPEIIEPKPMIAAFKKHRQERERKILACIESGAETVKKMLPIVYADIAENLQPAAARSLFATVIYLVEEQRVVALDGITIDGRYQIK